MTARPLAIVCSPCRGVGKTLLARLLAEFCALEEGGTVTAFDLADDPPRLADFLPEATAIAEVGDVASQMALFERLLDDDNGATIVDLGHRAFERFFRVVHEIDFFAEARRRAIEPLILFIVDPDPRSPAAYAELRERFIDASLLPVCNQVETTALVPADAPAEGIPGMVEIPRLPFALRALVDRPTFSFGSFWRAPPAGLAAVLDEELRDWLEGVFRQLHHLALAPRNGQTLARVRSRRPRSPAAAPVPAEVRKFAPKRLRTGDVPTDMFGGGIVDLLHQAGLDLRGAEARIAALEREVAHYRARALRAERWLSRVQREIEQRLSGPAGHDELDDLSA